MRLAVVIGSLTLSRYHPSIRGSQWKIVVPMSLEDLDANGAGPKGEELVACDQLSAGRGEWIALSEGAEAAMPFYPNPFPIDAYNAAIIDTIELDSQLVESRNP